MEDSYLWRKIQDYYGETKYNGTAQSIQKDRTIMGRPFKRWYIAPAAMVFQAICGSVYAWSVFNLPIDVAIYGSDQVNIYFYYGFIWRTVFTPIAFVCFFVAMDSWIRRHFFYYCHCCY